ncbi:MAG: hypothetical protein AB2603_20495 [Candidatus Thiodiazotropha endolucinida]
MKLGLKFRARSRKKARQRRISMLPQHDLLEHAITELVDSPRKKSQPAVGLSMLDIMACGLGGVALLAVLQMLIRIPLPPPLSLNFIMAEISAKGLGQIGFMVQPPKSQKAFFVIPDDGNQRPGQAGDLLTGDAKYATSVTYAQTFSNRDCTDAGPCRSVAYLHIENPAVEDWFIQPYYYQYQDTAPHSQISDFRTTTLNTLTCIYWSRDSTKTLNDGKCAKDDTLPFPGSFGVEVKIPVTGP